MKKIILFLGLSIVGTVGYTQVSQKSFNIKFSDSSINAIYTGLTRIEQILDNSNIIHSDVKDGLRFLEDLKGNIKTQYFLQLQAAKDSSITKPLVDSTKLTPKIKAKNVKH